MLGAVRRVHDPLVGLTLPADVVQVTVPGGVPQALRLTSSPTPIVVLDRLVGVVAQHREVISTMLKFVGMLMVVRLVQGDALE